MRLFRNISLIILISVIGGSCKKDPPIYPEDGCYDFPESSSFFGYNVIFPENSFEAPFYSSVNPVEIFYIQNYNEVGHPNELRSRNLITGTDRLIVSDGVWGQSDMNSGEWILFNHADNQVWKIKSNGDSLTQLTVSGLNHSARWSPTGDRFIYRHESGSAYYAIIADVDGNPLDTLNGFNYAYGDWSPDGMCISCWEMNGGLPTIIYYDLNDQTTHAVTSLSNADNIVYSQNWSPDGESIYLTAHDGIYKVNVATHTCVLLMASCESKTHFFVCVSPTGGKIAVDRTVSWIEGENDMPFEEYIVELNSDGTGERIVIQ